MRYFSTVALSCLLFFLGATQYADSQPDSNNGDTKFLEEEQKKELEEITGPTCFREARTGVYKTYKAKGYKAPSDRYIFIHYGACQCEGKTADECNEPGSQE